MAVLGGAAGDVAAGLGWLDLAEQLTQHVVELGFTHVELMPVMRLRSGRRGGTR